MYTGHARFFVAVEGTIMIHILVVEDDAKLNHAVCTYLNGIGYNAKGALNPNDAYDLMYNSLYDLIISDIMMPGVDGYEFAETVRDLNKTIPILFMTARDDFASKQKGFRVGIDDYMVKPVNMDELVLRVGALLRRANIRAEKKLAIGSLLLDADAMSAALSGEEVPVTVREFNILYKMLSYPKKTFSRQQLMDEFWDIDSETTLRAVDVYVTKLRDKFSDCKDFKIVTVHGLGYKAVVQ
jgi:DNA-binding response OmpR family regulator